MDPLRRTRFVAIPVLAAALLSTACGPANHDLQPGSYRAVVEVPGGDVPFGLDVAREQKGYVLYLVNGAERIRVPEVVVDGGHLTARMPGYENVLNANVADGELEGELTLLRSGGARQTLPFHARLGQAWRFNEQPLTDNADFAGRWSMTITEDGGKQVPAVAEFAQQFGAVTGTILTPTGDQRFLAGEARGDELLLSRFDGAQAHLYRARLDGQGRLVGEHWSGRYGHDRFVARRNPDAELDMSSVATALRDDGVKLEFSFPDLDGKPVSFADPRFQGKVVIVALAGSWCPNCHDEAEFLVELYKRYRAQGLEIVSLMYEHFGDFAQAAAATRRFRAEFGIEYPTLIAGVSDKVEAAKTLPQLNGVFAFPTTIFVGRDGRVRKIHAGFAGPATGAHHERLRQEFTAEVEALLAEPVAAADAATSGAATPAGTTPSSGG